MLLIILFIVSLVIIIPMVRKPLSEDDGNWFYPAVFGDRGVRIYKNFNSAYGYFCIQWMAAKLYNLLKIQKLAFFYYFKIIWYALTSVSIYWMTFCFWHNDILSLISALIFAIVTAVGNTLFVLTYGEHFFILPINLSIIFTSYGVSTGNVLYFFLAGLTSAGAFQIKPTALLFSIILPLMFHFSDNFLLALFSYSTCFIFLTCLPIALIYKQKGNYKYYLRMLIGPIIVLCKISISHARLSLINLFDNILKWLEYDAGVSYIESHYNKSLKIQWSSFKRFMLPAIKSLYLLLILSGTQVVLLFIKFDLFTFSIVLLFIIFLLMQQFQKNYYTPHFNPCWAPISILAAKTIWDMWPYLLNSGALGWAMITFMAIESIKIGRIIVKSFSKSERDRFGFLSPILGTLFRFSESIGQYIQQNSKEEEKLFVWGDQPSIYLYARREAFDTDYLIIYAHHGRILREKELLDSLREKPPELLLFYNYKVNDGWNIQRLQETIGIPYNHMRNFRITDDQRKSPQNPEGILYNFPLYRRDDEKYKEILLDRALIAQKNGGGDEARKHLEDSLQMLPKDYEASIWLSLLENNGDQSGRSRRYLEAELSENNDSFKRSILLRLLADMDVAAGDSNSAMEKYEKALKINSSDFRSYNGLGELYFSMGNTQAAFQCFQKAMELHPYSAEVFNNIGVLLAQTGKRDDAIKYFQKALAFMPSHPDALKNVEDLEEAKDNFIKSLVLNENQPAV